MPHLPHFHIAALHCQTCCGVKNRAPHRKRIFFFSWLYTPKIPHFLFWAEGPDFGFHREFVFLLIFQMQQQTEAFRHSYSLVLYTTFHELPFYSCSIWRYHTPSCWCVLKYHSWRRDHWYISEMLQTLLFTRKEMEMIKTSVRFTSKARPDRSNISRKGMVAIGIARNLSNNVFRATCLLEKKRILITFFLTGSSTKPPMRAPTRWLLSVRVNSVSETDCFAILVTVKSPIHFARSGNGCSWVSLQKQLKPASAEVKSFPGELAVRVLEEWFLEVPC